MSGFGPWKNFRSDPSSLRYATTVIISLSVVLVVIGALLTWFFAPGEYPTFGSALWLVLQTVTTVGYGDDPPVTVVGRAVTSVVMLSAIGITTVITAMVTSTFIESARAQRVGNRDDATAASLARIEASLASTQERLDRLEAGLAERSDGDADA